LATESEEGVVDCAVGAVAEVPNGPALRMLDPNEAAGTEGPVGSEETEVEKRPRFALGTELPKGRESPDGL
jgi:hypothetical protein